MPSVVQKTLDGIMWATHGSLSAKSVAFQSSCLSSPLAVTAAHGMLQVSPDASPRNHLDVPIRTHQRKPWEILK
jgi:hypothetical protein